MSNAFLHAQKPPDSPGKPAQDVFPTLGLRIFASPQDPRAGKPTLSPDEARSDGRSSSGRASAAAGVIAVRFSRRQSTHSRVCESRVSRTGPIDKHCEERTMTTQGNDDKYADSSHEDHAHSVKSRGRSKSGPASLLITGGVLLWIGAAALMTLPGFIPQYTWIFRHAAKHGITSGPLMLFGLCLCGLGFIARAIAAPKDEQEESQQRLRFDQLASELALVRQGIDSSCADLATVRSTTQSALELAQAEQANAASENRQDAIFRLAASLDQLGARIDQRVQVQQTAVQASIQELTRSISTMQDQVRELAASRPAMSSASQLMGRAIEMRNTHPNERSAIGMERVSAGSSLTSGSEGSLGLLDKLDDFGALHTSPDSPRLQIAHDAPRGRGLADVDGPPAPLPHGDGSADPSQWASNGARIEMPASPASELHQEFSTRDKLELLRSLMDDVRVREALGALTGPNG
jgi:hypothetical protein